ncbi:hypothetical protein G7078_04310 [Sphingomonas sinipercae]|uniref:Uncharacterized protein n=1 Tax=Sphingomonas sinipercae TaxID=2714944 RepID=A0A6G7ZM63_9SPHN|nr:hypothetical protein [Sphingomonas sinipercae]QIL02087.1 hypothetical protein G7078_04310 [Sphingomonas sinipercae]
MVVILTAPFVLLAMAQGKAGGLIWLMFPVVLFVPVLLASILLLAPFEATVERFGWNANILLPIFGGLLGGLVVAVAFKISKNPQVMTKLLNGDPAIVGATAGIILTGAVIAGLWRISLWALKWMDWA